MRHNRHCRPGASQSRRASSHSRCSKRFSPCAPRESVSARVAGHSSSTSLLPTVDLMTGSDLERCPARALVSRLLLDNRLPSERATDDVREPSNARVVRGSGLSRRERSGRDPWRWSGNRSDRESPARNAGTAHRRTHT